MDGFAVADHFDGADDLTRVWREGLAPDPDFTVSAWADRHRILSPRGANEAGPWRTSRTPYLREIMDALSPAHPAQRVVFMKGAQVGATESGNNWIGYVVAHAPGPMLAVQPTVELAKRFSTQRVGPLVEDTPQVRARIVPSRARDSGNTVLSKEFPGGILVLTGANSAVGLRSMPARYLFLDEIDGYPPSADEEGEPVALAEARTRTFSWRRKVFLVSTPTIRGRSRIEREYEASDQRRYFVPCPLCGGMQWLKFERLRWEWGNPASIAYVCEHCERPFAEHYKAVMLARGEWRPTAISADAMTIGFHISGLYSPIGWLSWERIAREWEAAQASDEGKRAFKNGILGETWMEPGEAPDWQRLYDRREDFLIGVVPEGGLILTAGADVQKDRIEVSVWAWGRGLESWLVEHIIIDGSPIEAETWADMDRLLVRTWRNNHGNEMMLARLAIDTGGQHTAEVYAWARRHSVSQVMPVKGVDGFDRTTPVAESRYDGWASGKRTRTMGGRIWKVAVAVFKSELYGQLRLDPPIDEDLDAGEDYPPGYVHLPRIDAERTKQLVAEQLVSIKDRRGFTKFEWQKLRERNEMLDCRVYARAAAWLLGVAHRIDEATWRRLEAQLAVPLDVPLNESASHNNPPPPPPTHYRRPRGAGRSRWMSE